MRLPDALRRKREQEPLDPRVEADLEAIDAALRSDSGDFGLEGLALLASDLRAERERPSERFAAELDGWAAAGFPRGERPGAEADLAETADTPDSPLERARARFASTPPRRLLAPAMAAACVVVIAGVSIARYADDGNSGAGSGDTATLESSGSTSVSPPSGDAAPSAEAPPSAAAPDSSASGSGAAQLAPTPSRSASSGATAGAGKLAPRQRKVERQASLSLEADPAEVDEVASKAGDVASGYGGYILSSDVSGSDESARASLELAIPTRNLDAALADLADLAEVHSRSESSDDITGSFTSAREQLREYRAERASLLKRLAKASSEARADSLKRQIALINSQISSARSQARDLKHRASISRVSVQISSARSSSASGSSDGGWDLGDAVDDAGHVISVIAGVALISAAVLLPLALLALIVVLALRVSRRRARERTLDES